ncbi:MAG: sulfatase [Planctomycetota bacterium]
MRLVTFAALCFLVAPSACSVPRDSPAPRPNIVLIVADDHAYHALSCYGGRVNRTPNLDRIAASGMRFDRAFVTDSLCGPSRACIMTGKYGHVNGYKVHSGSFDASQWTMPKELQRSGYATAAIGKWHLGSAPTGFDHHDVLPGQGVYRNPAFLSMGPRTRTEGYVTDIITDKAIAWLSDRPKDRPFFLFVGHKAPHRPWVPDEKHAANFAGLEIPEPETLFDDYATRQDPIREAKMRVAEDLTKTDVKADPPPGLSGDHLTRWYYRRYMQDYLACVQSVDDNVGRLIDWLDQHGLGENTMVVYTSDNGFFLGDHGFYDKRFMYEESMRVPLLIRWPGHVAPGSSCSELVTNADLAPTFLAAAGAEIPAEVQGSDLGPLLAGCAEGWRDSIYYRYYEYPRPHRVRPHYGVRTRTHKLIYYPDLCVGELFDLERDPKELRNLYGDPGSAEPQRTLERELERLQRRLGDEPSGGPAPGGGGQPPKTARPAGTAGGRPKEAGRARILPSSR